MPEADLDQGVGAHPPLERAPVPLYYFNVYNDDTRLDEEGAELADAHAPAPMR